MEENETFASNYIPFEINKKTNTNFAIKASQRLNY